MENKIQKLADIIKNSKYLVFFTGAGVSTDSGLKSFRGKDGLYSTLYKGKYRPEEVLSSDFFYSHRNIFMEYVENELNINGIKPNKGHLALAELERIGLLKAVITQNIDDLHQMAGNKNVLELHGPDVTLYGESLNQAVVNEAIYQLEQADTLIVAGTSLTVYPAAYYLRYFKGKNLVIINNENTQYDSEASLVLNSNFADTMDKVINIIKMGA